jgi:hypothetical protein
VRILQGAKDEGCVNAVIKKSFDLTDREICKVFTITKIFQSLGG